jgi:hypothetical protein
MSFKLARNVFEVLRGSARTKSLEQLRREGHQHVPVLRFSDLEALMAAAVDDTLTRLGLELSDHQIAGLNDESRLRFLALLRERQQLKDTLDSLQRQGDKLEVTTEGVRAEIERAQAELVEEETLPAPMSVDEDVEVLRAKLREVLGVVLQDAARADPDLPTRVMAAVDTAVENYRILVAAKARTEQEGRVEQLNRRLQRLRRKLEESEVLLARARAAAASGGALMPLFDPGKALQPGDADYAQKKGLLDEVFQLNVELRKMIAAKD